MGFGRCPIAILDDVAGGGDAIATAVELAGFRVLDAPCAGQAGIMLASAQRARALDKKQALPVLVYGLPEGTDLPPLADERLLPPDDPRFAAHLSAWAPPSTDTIERMIAVFGEAEVARLAGRLHERLLSIVKQGLPGAHDSHQLAGFAGTLGFAGLHHGLQRLSEGDATASRLVLHQAHMAILAIEALPLFSARH